MDSIIIWTLIRASSYTMRIATLNTTIYRGYFNDNCDYQPKLLINNRLWTIQVQTTQIYYKKVIYLPALTSTRVKNSRVHPRASSLAPRPCFSRIGFALLFLLLPCIPVSLLSAPEEKQSLLDKRTLTAARLMDSYAKRTGLTSGLPDKRYLWTDAFAVCNYLGLARISGDAEYTDLALKLVERVHHTLGRHRDDEPRSGWISGMSEEAGELHPTRGGLRIGKTLPERSPYEEFNPDLEWDRDGQYFHYLSKWMHALDQVTRATGDARYNIWARELDVTAFNAFSYETVTPGAPRRMVWKMSIDLSRSQVPSMGKHDPLDGYITSLQLASTSSAMKQPDTGSKLEDEISEFERMVHNGDWKTEDPLGLGGLLVEAWRLMQLQHQGVSIQPQLLQDLIEAAATGLHYFARGEELHKPPQYRLAFREFGLAIGLHALERMRAFLETEDKNNTINPHIKAQLGEMMQHMYIREHIENFWLYAEHQKSNTWTEHRDINEVMLATSLAPEGFLELLRPGR